MANPLISWCVFTVLTASTCVASAQVPERPPKLSHALSTAAASSNLAPITGMLGYRVRRRDLQVGVELELGYARKSFISGYEVRDGALTSGLLLAQGVILREGPMLLAWRGTLGARQLLDMEAPIASTRASDVALDRSTALHGEAAMLAYVDPTPALTLRVGGSLLTALQLRPDTGLDTLGFLSMLGAAVHVSPHVSLTADVAGGGVFGFDGDGNKLLVRGQLGVRLLLEDDTRSWRAY